MNNKAIALYKEHNTNQFNPDKFYTKNDVERTFLQNGNIFNSIEDGVSVLDGEFNIQNINFTMQTWYAHKAMICGEKCFDVYHSRKAPCANCPVVRTLETGTASRDIIPYKNEKKKISGWHDLQAFPVRDGTRIVGVVEFVRDATYQMDLYSKIALIEQDMNHLKEQNRVLKSFLQQKESEKQEIEKSVTSNIRKYINPVLKQMKEALADKPMEYGMITLLDNLFEHIMKPYFDGVTDLNNFTSREIQIMSLIKSGKTSKEIAQDMCLSCKTVDFHRANIREKLGLKKNKDNLRSSLLSTVFYSDGIY